MIPAILLAEMALGLAAIGAGCVWLAMINRRARKNTDRDLAWLDERIAATTDMSRRSALRALRRGIQKEDM